MLMSLYAFEIASSLKNRCIVHCHVQTAVTQTCTVLAVVSEGRGNAFVMPFRSLIAAFVKRLSEWFHNGSCDYKHELNPVQLVKRGCLIRITLDHGSQFFFIVAITLPVRWCK